MVVRNDFLYWLCDNLRFNVINEICTTSDIYLNGLVNLFNELDCKECFKYNDNLTLDSAKFSLNWFFENINLNRYDYVLKHGILSWKIDNNTYVGLNSDKSNYNNGVKYIDSEYLKEWKEYSYYYWKD